jgi:hypothetical protein
MLYGNRDSGQVFFFLGVSELETEGRAATAVRMQYHTMILVGAREVRTGWKETPEA